MLPTQQITRFLYAFHARTIAALNVAVNSLAKYSIAYYVKMDARNKLRELIDRDYNGNQAEFARAIKRSASLVNQYISGHRNLAGALASHIEDTLNLPRGYFTSVKYSRLSDARGHYHVDKNQETSTRVPIITREDMGAWLGNNENKLAMADRTSLPCPADHGARTFAYRVVGDAMTAPYGKSYPPDSFIYVDPDQADIVHVGDRILAQLADGEVVFRQLAEERGRKLLQSLNQQYPLIDSEFVIIGRVIGKWEAEP